MSEERSEERKKVLEMLARGTISVADAEKLLEKIAEPGSGDARTDANSSSGSAKPRFMRIVIEKPGEKQVNVRMPLAFMRSGTGLLAVLPTKINEKLAELGLDFSACCEMNEKEWAEAIENMNIDIDKGNGKKVKVFCE
jgi:hypothetical protein